MDSPEAAARTRNRWPPPRAARPVTPGNQRSEETATVSHSQAAEVEGKLLSKWNLVMTL